MFQPLHDKLLIRRKDKEILSEGGIFIPTDITKEQPCEGVILAIGSGKFNTETGETIPMVVKVGDKVLFGKFGGTDYKENDETLLIHKEDDVIGIFGEGSESYIETDEGEQIAPIRDYIIFRFMANLTKSTFQPVAKSGIIISDVGDLEEHTKCQWAEVLAYGPECSEEIKKSKYVFLEAYGWTGKVRLNGPHGNVFWKTEERFVLLTSDEYHNPY